MSKTYRDAPYRILVARDPHRKADHHWSCDGENCDIENSLLHRSNLPREVHRYPAWLGSREWKYTVHPACDYSLPSEEHRYWWDHGVPRDFIVNTWYAPARTEERVRLRDAVKDYNGNGDTEHVELDHQQHRHQSSYYYW